MTAHCWRMVRDAAGPAPFRFERVAAPLPLPGPNEALVEIAACGICGTDLAYFHGAVATATAPPLTLGHEASGRIVGGARHGQPVIIPTILPCRSCELCRSGRANRCLRQKMFGGNHGAKGCFASHVVVPLAELTPVPADCRLPLERLAVVADAVSTPYQAMLRARVGAGAKVAVIGATGGLGVYLVQWARLLGAAVVAGIGRDEARLQALMPFGLGAAVTTGDRPADAIRHDLWRACKAAGANPRFGWTIFEASGTLAGQELGLALLAPASRLVLVGYAAGTLTHNLSRLMAQDSEILGSWGCDPRHYGAVLRHVAAGGINIKAFTETRPMGRIAECFAELKTGRGHGRRIVLTNDWLTNGEFPW